MANNQALRVCAFHNLSLSVVKHDLIEEFQALDKDNSEILIKKMDGSLWLMGLSTWYQNSKSYSHSTATAMIQCCSAL